jgi:hypothetical protein
LNSTTLSTFANCCRYVNIYPNASLLLCRLITPSRVNPAWPCISHDLKSLIERCLVVKSIRKIPVCVVNHQVTNTDLFPHGTNIIVGTVWNVMLTCKSSRADPQHSLKYLLPYLQHERWHYFITLFSVAVKKKQWKAITNPTTFYFSLLNSLFYSRSIFFKWNEKFILINRYRDSKRVKICHFHSKHS